MAQVKKMGFNDVNKAQIERLSSTEAKLHLDFTNGDKVSFDVIPRWLRLLCKLLKASSTIKVRLLSNRLKLDSKG